MILAANAAVGVITETNAEKALEVRTSKYGPNVVFNSHDAVPAVWLFLFGTWYEIVW
jgi:hypothetical protein